MIKRVEFEGIDRLYQWPVYREKLFLNYATICYSSPQGEVET